MLGILLLGGSGTRLSPMTKFINKHLMPINDMPMFFYPLSFLISAGVRDFVFIINPDDKKNYECIVGDGSGLGIKISYEIQTEPDGIPSAAYLGKNNLKIEHAGVLIMLGDNMLVAPETSKFIRSSAFTAKKSHIFTYHVQDPSAFGVYSEGKNEIIEKPSDPESNYAVIGLYYYPKTHFNKFAELKKSDRGETEITDVNNDMLKSGDLNIIKIKRGAFWLDAGSFQDFNDASSYFSLVQRTQGLRYGCVDEICYRLGLITREELLKRANFYGHKSDLGKYILDLSQENIE